MLVEVVELRRLGERLPRDEVRVAVPTTGVLLLDGRGRGEPLLAALVHETRLAEFVLAPLHDAVVRKIRGDSLIVAGLQEIAIGRKRSERYAQAWWCRLVQGRRPPAPPDPPRQSFFGRSGLDRAHQANLDKIAADIAREARERAKVT